MEAAFTSAFTAAMTTASRLDSVRARRPLKAAWMLAAAAERDCCAGGGGGARGGGAGTGAALVVGRALPRETGMAEIFSEELDLAGACLILSGPSSPASSRMVTFPQKKRPQKRSTYQRSRVSRVALGGGHTT